MIALASASLAAARVEAKPSPPQLAVQALLDRRAAAVLAGDEAAFMATVDPQASAIFRESQRRQLQGFASVSLSSYRLEARTDDSGDLSVALTGRYPGAARTFLPETRQRWRLQGFDDRDALDRLWLSYVERDGRWYVAGDSDVADLGLTTPPGLWDGGPVVVQRTARVAVLSHPAEAARAQALAALAEQAIDRAGGWHWPGRIVVILPSSPDELAAIIRATLDVEKYVAFVSYDAETEPAYVTSAPRMYVQDRNLSKYSSRYQVETLVHELVHAAAAPASGPAIPSWVHEGVADWIATGQSTALRRPRGSDGVLPRDEDFRTGSREAITTAYGESRSVVSYLARRAGAGSPIAFFQALGALRDEPGSETHLTDRALRAATGGLPLAQLEAGWAGR